MITDLDALARAWKVVLIPGSTIVFQVKAEDMRPADKLLSELMPLFKARGIAALLFSEDVSMVMVPEAQRVLPLGRMVGP